MLSALRVFSEVFELESIFRILSKYRLTDERSVKYCAGMVDLHSLEPRKTLDLESAAKRCAELGNITRLSIFRLLVKAGDGGLPVGEIQKILEIPGSTLSHHIQRLVQVGLVYQRRESRTLHCEPQFSAIRELAAYLLSECCSMQSEKNGS